MSYESMIREGENEVDIVIIDDEPKIRNGLRHFLDKQEGWNVTGAFENAVDALAFLSHHDADAVITDIKMPEMNGLDMIARLRERDTDTEIIIMSGYPDFRFAQQAIELGVLRYLVKPANPRELLQILKGVEEKHGRVVKKMAEPVYNLLVKKAADYIEENYGEKISVKEIAEHLYVTPNYLSDLFKRHTGKNISAYITDVRLEKAKEYLTIPECNVAFISERVGIGNSRYFSNLFKKKYGMTPSEYRNTSI